MNRVVIHALVVMAFGVLGACGGSSNSSGGTCSSSQEGDLQCAGAAAKSSDGRWSGTALLETCSKGEWVTETDCTQSGGACIDVGMPPMCM